MNTSFTIAEHNMDLVSKLIEKSNRRAVKNGFVPLTITITEERFVEVRVPNPRVGVQKIKVFDIEVNGVDPHFKGWKFMGTLDLKTVPGSVIVKARPGVDIPEEYRHTDGTCDHCNKKRSRKETFVLGGVEENAGQFIKVGRTCLQDFLGADPRQQIEFMETLHKIGEYSGDCGEPSEYGSRIPLYVGTDEILQVTCAVIDADGWVARSAYIEGTMPTADKVISVFFPPNNGKARELHLQWIATVDLANEKHKAEAAAVRQWLEEQESNNEYIHNLKTLNTVEAIEPKMFGLWCSAVAAYRRAMQALESKQREKKTNEYAGSVGDKIELTVKVVRVQHLNGQYGTVRLFKMVDDQGRTIVWFANTKPDMYEGDTVKIKGTVKKTDEYQGWKQTTLTRVKVLDVIEEAA